MQIDIIKWIKWENIGVNIIVPPNNDFIADTMTLFDVILTGFIIPFELLVIAPTRSTGSMTAFSSVTPIYGQ